MEDHEQDHDLSPYEIARLKRILENKRVIAQLGIKESKPDMGIRSQVSGKRKRKSKARASAKRSSKAVPRRRSKRLMRQQTDFTGDKQAADVGGAVKEEEEEEEDAIDLTYDDLPVEPTQLDEHEFLVYVALRKWRLDRKRELDIEPYKICQNRTLCELIRRRRNDVDYASKPDTAVEEDLLECWGIGPSKAAEGGYGREMLVILEQEELKEHMSRSREKGTKFIPFA